jgi:molybdopterin-guanine dinucleotide biosynthesis protein A
MSPAQAVAGVLIGGQSRRMGACKALLEYEGQTFVERTISAAQPVVGEVVLLGNTRLNLPQLAELVQLADEPDAGGPLAGLASLLNHAGNRWALLMACDMPLISTAILQRLMSACAETVDAAVIRVVGDGRAHFPCCAAFHPRVAPEARGELARSARLRALISRIRCRVLELDGTQAECLRSINTPAEYAELVRRGAGLVTIGSNSP